MFTHAFSLKRKLLKMFENELHSSLQHNLLLFTLQLELLSAAVLKGYVFHDKHHEDLLKNLCP